MKTMEDGLKLVQRFKVECRVVMDVVLNESAEVESVVNLVLSGLY